MGVLLDNQSFITVQIQFVEETNSKHGNVTFRFIRSQSDYNSWKTKGYSTKEEIQQFRQNGSSSDPGMPEKKAPDPKKVIQILKTWWSRMSWKEQNNIYSQCLKQIPLPTGATHTELDALRYRDLKLKTCLKKWDLKDDSGNPIELKTTVIDSLVPEVAQELLDNFEKITEVTNDELGE